MGRPKLMDRRPGVSRGKSYNKGGKVGKKSKA